MDAVSRNFTTISPSAVSLLLMKAHTNLPYARETAELFLYPDKFIPDFKNRDLSFWARTLHFESRYRSLDQLMTGLPVTNILELSSGYSFRSLKATMDSGVYYIDTDLPEVINIKKHIINTLLDETEAIKGKLEFQPLNALDERRFFELADQFPSGEILIINEGLLMYLDRQEKEKLCGSIRKILEKRGGYWITSDIYIKNKFAKMDIKLDTKTKDFFSQHKIEENRFESFEEAREFFSSMGFTIDKEAKIKSSELSSFRYFLKSIGIKQIFNLRKAGKIQASWRLKLSIE